MNTYTTELGYVVVETTNGLDVYEDEEMNDFVCELGGKTLSDFTYDGVVNDDELETEIKEQIDFNKHFA